MHFTKTPSMPFLKANSCMSLIKSGLANVRLNHLDYSVILPIMQESKCSARLNSFLGQGVRGST